MVSLEDRSVYFKPYLENQRFVFLYEFVFFQKVADSFKPVLESDTYLKLVADSIIANDKRKFIKTVSFFEQRQPNEDADYINDDILLFTLLCGFAKFSLDPKWVIECLNFRSASSPEEIIKRQTFLNIAQKNYESTDNNFGIIIVIERIISQVLLPNSLKARFYETTANLDFPPFNDAVLSMLAIRGFDILLIEWDRSDNNDLIRLEAFESSFLARSYYLAVTIYVLFFVAVFYFLWKYLSDPNYTEFFEKLDKFLGIGGFSILGVLSFKYVVKKLLQLIKLSFGYNPQK